MKKTLNELGVVVLFWNDSKKTIKCLKSLLNQQKQKFNIILVDNNSDQIFSKKVLDWLKKKKINSIKVKKIFNEIFEIQKKRIHNALLSSTSEEVLSFDNVLKKIING